MGIVPFAGAQTGSSTATSSPAKTVKLPANRVEIGPSGEANIVGNVTAVSSGSISIKSWGGVWNVAVATDTVVAGVDIKGDVSQIKIGDVVGVHGRMSSDSNLVLKGKVIKDFSLSKNSGGIKKEGKDDEHKEINNKKLNLLERMREFLKKKNATSSDSDR